jgi:histidinol-phosphate aminotransferase
VDEAYYGFCKQTALPLISDYDNLVVCRTFSKSAGFAGSRIGYLMAQKSLAQLLYRFRPMYEANAFGVLAAMEILDHPGIVDAYLEETEKGRIFVKEYLDRMSINYLDTHANFIHVDFGTYREQIADMLAENGILVRGGPGVAGYDSYIRISLGPVESMAPAMAIIDAYVQSSNLEEGSHE